jgi:hypothetical protein
LGGFTRRCPARIRPSRPYLLPRGLIDFSSGRAEHCRNAIRNMSPAQAATVDAAVLGDTDRMLGSDRLHAMLADATMFGEPPILR